MVFNSIPFLLFFVVVFFVYWVLLKKSTKAQNVFLLVASYFFYGYANWRMLPLLVVSTVVFYFLGKGIGRAKTEKMASWLRVFGVVLGVGLLFYFKYLGFFVNAFFSLSLRIIMPLGVSFFTFRLMSYVMDVYNGEVEPTENIVDFAVYISFFPCILSGPIDRPKFIGQLQRKREFHYDQAVDGMRQILWGLFKKIVVADNCSVYVDQVFSTYADQSGSTLLLAAICCSFQVYADFSGYSDKAIGVGTFLGFSISRNFDCPFFALNVADFWRRWHMSLTTWMTDYVFTPLNFRFRHWGKTGIILAVVINMVLVGMWHGADWTFALFGLYHGLLFIPLILSGAFMKKAKLRTIGLGLPVLADLGRMLLTFALVVFGVIIFRSESIGQAWAYVCGMGDKSLLAVPWLINRQFYIPLFANMTLLIIVEWINRSKSHPLDLSSVRSHAVKYMIYFVIITLIIFFTPPTPSPFVYFQF